jgi:hypothetical protein
MSEFAPCRGSSTGVEAWAVVELVVEPVETQSRHRVPAEADTRRLSLGVHAGVERLFEGLLSDAFA